MKSFPQLEWKWMGRNFLSGRFNQDMHQPAHSSQYPIPQYDMKRFLQQPALYLVLLLSGCVAQTDFRNTHRQVLPNLAPESSANTHVNYITEVVESVGTALVRIDSTRTVEISPDPILERFFRGELPTREEVQQGLGSGFITTSDGLIFTNAHVVANADSVTVLLKDGRRFTGEVVGADTVTDVAVIKIAATELPLTSPLDRITGDSKMMLLHGLKTR
jgi:S1-C subfamily serine protease